MKITKEILLKENTVLVNELGALQAKDKEIRTSLSSLLGCFDRTNEWNRGNKSVLLQDWLSIAFLIGELKADADYSVMLSSKFELKQENELLRKRIFELEHPLEKK